MLSAAAAAVNSLVFAQGLAQGRRSGRFVKRQELKEHSCVA
jgi:hypothetical protein